MRRAVIVSALALLAAMLATLVPPSPASAFGPSQTAFRGAVQALTGTLDVHSVGSGAVVSGGNVMHYTSDQHISGTLTLNTWNPLTNALTGMLDGAITINESETITSACTITLTYSASTSAQSDFLGQPLLFNLSFDIGSDTWSLWPSNASVNGTVKNVTDCGGQPITSSAINPLRFMPLDLNLGFPFPSTGFDLAGTQQRTCASCGNTGGTPVTATYTYDLKATISPCTYTLSSPTAVFTGAASTGTVTVATGPGCPWTVGLPLDPWVAITSIPIGSGPGTVSYAVGANTGGSRSTSFSVAGQTFMVSQSGPGALFVPTNPCRIADTRNAPGSFGGPVMSGGSTRTFVVPQSACGIPANAVAYSLNVTVVPRAGLGYLTLFPTGQQRPFVSTLNSPTGKVVANAALVPAGSGGAIDVFVTDTTDVVLDIDGYFVPPGGNGLAFYPVSPCRVLDTRNAAGPLGGPGMGRGTTRTFPVPSSACNVPATAQAYSFNATVVPQGGLGYLSLWPAGQAQPFVSTLNSVDGSIVANAAIVPAGSAGAIDAYVTDPTDLVLDINGYFAPPGNGGFAFYPATPCRVADTRNAAGTFGGPTLPAGATRSFAVPLSACAIPVSAQAYSLNATVVPAAALGYLTLWPAGGTQPFVSTLNSPLGLIVANAALVPAGTNGAVSAFVTDRSDLVLDINGYFSP